MVHIARLNPRDPVVAQQFHAVWLLAHAQEAERLRIDPAEVVTRTADDIGSGNDVHLGAFIGATLVGALSLARDDEPGQISVATLVVHPQHQRRGIARSLMQEALQRGKGGVFSVCTALGNEPALALYRSLGFVAYRRGTMGPQALPLVKLRRPVQSS